MKLTGKEIRQRLPGQRIETVLIADSTRQIKMVIDCRGFFEQLIVTEPCFWLYYNDIFLQGFMDINAAVKAWDNLETPSQNCAYHKIQKQNE